MESYYNDETSFAYRIYRAEFQVTPNHIGFQYDTYKETNFSWYRSSLLRQTWTDFRNVRELYSGANYDVYDIGIVFSPTHLLSSNLTLGNSAKLFPLVQYTGSSGNFSQDTSHSDTAIVSFTKSF